MIYPATFEQKIGFDRLREQVAALCTMRAARGRLADEGFSTSPREIERRLALADEMRLVLEMERDFPGGEYPDVDYVVAKLRVEGSFLDVEEVVTLRKALSVVGGIVAFILGREEHYPTLYARTRGVAAFPEIVRRIDAILDGSILTAPTKTIPYFNFEVPTALPGVDPAILDPRDTYPDAGEWDTKAKDLASRFVKNFSKYAANEAGKALVAAGPKAE